MLNLMKKLKVFLNSRNIIALMMVTSLLAIMSCDGGEDPEPPVPGTVDGDVPEFAVVNVPVTLIDKSLSVASREWTITGGTPATSTDKSVEVTFTTAGNNSVSLKVTFENGTEVTETYAVTVAEELNGAIDATGGDLSFAMGDKDVSFTYQLSVANAVGDPDGYSWVFPAGSNPETSTEANPTVSFVGDKVEVTVTISRSVDGASLTLTETIELAAPANLWTADYWGFEGDGVLGWLQTWDGDAGGPWAAGVVELDENSYDGKGITIRYPGDKGYYGVISRDYWDHNAQLTKGDIVLFSFYAKVVSGTPTGFTRIVNHLPDWSISNNPELQAQNYQFYNNQDIQNSNIGSEWTRVTMIDTLADLETATAANVFPEIGFTADGGAAVISFDKLELRLLGNTND